MTDLTDLEQVSRRVAFADRMTAAIPLILGAARAGARAAAMVKASEEVDAAAIQAAVGAFEQIERLVIRAQAEVTAIFSSASPADAVLPCVSCADDCSKCGQA